MASEAPSWEQIKKLEMTYQILSAIDAVQTIRFLERGTAVELNPIFSKYPSEAKIIGIKIVGGIGHYYIIKYIYSINPKIAKYAQYSSIAFQGSVVLWNAKYAF